MSVAPRAVSNPIDVISAARRRIATLAAIRAAAKGIIPSLAALVIAIALDAIGDSTWMLWGYVLPPEPASGVRATLFASSIAGFIVSALAAHRAFRMQGFTEAAAEVDRKVAAKEEILTLAHLSDPAAKTAAPECARSPLYPILWRRAAEMLYRFDPSTEFRLEIVPSIRSGLLASIAILVLLTSFLGLMVERISPFTDAAQRMLETAKSLDRSDSGSAETKAMADRLRDAAKALNDSVLSREDKLEQMAAISHELEQQQKPQNPGSKQQANGNTPGNQSAKNQSGSGSGQAKGDKGGKSGSGNGGSSNGDGTGTESGSGSNQSGNNKSADKQSAKNESTNNGKNSNQIAELSKDLQKDQQKLESRESNTNAKQAGGSDQSKKGNSGSAPRAGQNPNQSGSQKQGNGTAEASGGQPGQKNSQNVSSPAGKPGSDQPHNDTGGTSGDTHLGQFPTPGRYERFYKPGEKGELVEIKDARYVLFRIPPASTLDGSGRIVMDSDRPTASTPYTNAPLKDERLSASPEERQLIPPRYRDLLH